MSTPFDPDALSSQLKAAYPSVDAERVFRNPVFIVSAPRSGSTLLFEQLSGRANFWTIGGESHGIFRAFPKLRAENARFDSGMLTAAHADENTIKSFRDCFLYLLRDKQGQAFLTLREQDRPGQVCLLEKTPRNALNIPFLLEVFPTARFVFLYREPRASVASLIEAWTVGLQTGRFVTFQELPGWDRRGWCFLLPPGWQELRAKSLAEISAFQWSSSNRKIIADLQKLSGSRWISITYNNLLSDPDREISRIAKFSGVDLETGGTHNRNMPLSNTTLTPPHADKWKRREAEIAPMLPMLNDTHVAIQEFCNRADGD